MEVLKEVTEWDGNYNHTYLVDGDKIIAYKPHYGMEIRLTNLTMSRRGRKFEKFPFIAEDWPGVEVQADPNIIEVHGSKGSVYKVDIVKKTCSCSGFKFRQYCKHVESL